MRCLRDPPGSLSVDTSLMEAEISESLSRLRQIGSELGVGEESQTEAIEEDSFDYTERVLFSEIREIKNVILSFFIHSS